MEIAHQILSPSGNFQMMNHVKSLIRANISFWSEVGGISLVVAA